MLNMVLLAHAAALLFGVLQCGEFVLDDKFLVFVFTSFSTVDDHISIFTLSWLTICATGMAGRLAKRTRTIPGLF